MNDQDRLRASVQPERPTEDSFNHAVHGLRGIAVLLIFAAYALGSTYQHAYQDRPAFAAYLARPWQLDLQGVYLLFLISGFVILPSMTRYSAGQFALRRFLRLYPLFFALTSTFVVINAVNKDVSAVESWRVMTGGLSFWGAPFQTAGLAARGGVLILPVAFYGLAFAGLTFWLKRPSLLPGAAVALLSAAFLFLYPAAIYFAAGLTIRLLHDRGMALRREVAWILELAAALSCAYFASLDWFVGMAGQFAVPMALSIAAYFFLAVSPGSLTARMLAGPAISYLGTVSYSLCMVHPISCFGMQLLFRKLGLFTDHIALSMLLFLLVTTPMTLLLAHIVHHLIERRLYKRVFGQPIYRLRVPGRLPVRAREASPRTS